MSEHGRKAVVIDNGTDTIKVGMSGDHKPKCLMPTMMGRHENPDGHLDGGEGPTKVLYMGFEAESRRTMLELSDPVRRGVVTNWDDMQLLWEHAINDELGVDAKAHPILLADTPNNTEESREKTAEIFLERFQAPAMLIVNQAVLALYSTGKFGGTVLDIGHGVTSAVPVDEGWSVKEGVVKVEMGGADLTDYMVKMLSDRGYDFSNPSNRAHVQDIKEQFGYVAPDFDKETKKMSKPKPHSATTDEGPISQNYELPDGQTISIKSERFRCPEALFQPHMLELDDSDAIHRLIEKAVTSCNSDLKKMLYNNIVVCGGSSLFEGLTARLTHEMAKLHHFTKPKVTLVNEPLVASWLGGSIFADLPAFKDMVITKQQYEEEGTAIVHRKCCK